MTIKEIKERLEDVFPHQYSDDRLIDWVNDLEIDISNSMLPYDRTGIVGAEQHESINDRVIVDDKELYVEFLICKICLANEEYDRYNNHAQLFNAKLQDWKDRYIRQNRPVSAGGYKL